MCGGGTDRTPLLGVTTHQVLGEEMILERVAQICVERLEDQMPVSWSSINIELMEDFGNCTIMTCGILPPPLPP
jgi:hypothetical protein